MGHRKEFVNFLFESFTLTVANSKTLIVFILFFCVSPDEEQTLNSVDKISLSCKKVQLKIDLSRTIRHTLC